MRRCPASFDTCENTQYSRTAGERVGDEQRRRRDEAVDENRHARVRRFDERARDHRDLEAAERGEHVERLARVRVPLERAPEHRALVREARVVEARAAADARVDRHVEQAAHHARGRRGVRDPHLAEADHVGAERRVMPHARGARGERGERFVPRHRALLREVARAARDRGVDELRRSRQRRRDARIDDLEREARDAGERVDRRAARDEVRDHLRGHRLRIRAHAFGGDPVIAGEHDHRRARDARRARALDHAELQRERFETAEAAGRLRLVIDDACERRAQCGVVERIDARQGKG